MADSPVAGPSTFDTHMSMTPDSPDSRSLTESEDDEDQIIDDGGLTIRIPNPNIYLARQTHWKGRRGKPRCDNCRMNNLKCDREHPACNHCQYSNGKNCEYTPLPTPAHRGIPRCDRCRTKNLKCDRNLPVCNHCDDHEDAECNYTPKKRHKIPVEAFRSGAIGVYGKKAASFLVQDMPPVEDPAIVARRMRAESSSARFYGHNVGSSPGSVVGSLPSMYELHESDGPDFPRYAPNGQYTPEYRGWNSKPIIPSKPHTHHLSFITHTFPPDQGVVITKALVEPWYHASFASLPDVVLQRLRTVNSVEMPDRIAFDASLYDFLTALTPELRETAAFGPELYANMSNCVAHGDMSMFSPRLRMWLAHHHIRLGSNKFHLLLIPRDAFFQIDVVEEEKLRMDYVTRVDGKSKGMLIPSPAKDTVEHDLNALEWTKTFERVPVQTQIYDVLVYAHRAHGNSTSMLFEARRIGMASITYPMAEIFIRLCPLCNIRRKSVGTVGVIKPEQSTQFSIYDPDAKR